MKNELRKDGTYGISDPDNRYSELLVRVGYKDWLSKTGEEHSELILTKYIKYLEEIIIRTMQ